MPVSADHFALRSRRIVTPDGVIDGAIRIRDGRIAAVGDTAECAAGLDVVDLEDRVVMPGVIDAHVHVNEPGRTHWEGFRTATRSAAAGGVTTIVDMPLNSIPATTTRAALEEKMRASEGKLFVDCGFYGGLIPGSGGNLADLVAGGVLGIKAFLVDSGVPEFPPVSLEELEAVMPSLQRTGVPLLVHAELPDADEPGTRTGPVLCHEAYMSSRPARWEERAVQALMELARRHRCRVHIVHLATASVLPRVAEAVSDGVCMTLETCPHYLYFDSRSIEDGATLLKCAPPIRDPANARALWAGLVRDRISFVASDHSPAPAELKCGGSGDFARAWGGIASLQFLLPVMWTLARERGCGLADLCRWMCERPAAFLGLAAKGAIRPGMDADLTVWNPEDRFTVSTDRIEFRNPITPYVGHELYGTVELTMLRGRRVFDRGSFPQPPSGRAVLRSREGAATITAVNE